MPSAARRGKRRRHPAPDSRALRTIGERIRAARQQAGLSQSQVGRPHFTRAYVSAVELGKIRPSMRSLEFLAERLGRPASSFLEDASTRERELAVLRAKERLLTGRPREAGPVLADALRRAERAGDPDALAEAYADLAEARWASGEEDALDQAERAVAAATNATHPLGLARALYLRAVNLIALGRLDEAVPSVERAIESAAVAEDASSLARAYTSLAEARHRAGDVEGAVRWMARAVCTLIPARELRLLSELRDILAGTRERARGAAPRRSPRS